MIIFLEEATVSKEIRVYAPGEDLRTLRLTSELVDLRVANANPIIAQRARSWARSRTSRTKEKTDHEGRFSFVYGLRKRYFLWVALRIGTPTQNNVMDI